MLPLFFFPRPIDSSVIPEQAFSLFFILSNIFYIAFYYANTNLLIPKILERKQVMLYIGIILLLMIFSGVFPRLYQYFFGDIQRFATAIRPNKGQRYFRPAILSPGSIAIFLLVLIFSTGIKVISQWFQAEKRNKEIQNEKLQTELSFLKAQINPHFLFNTLNNIYALAAAGSERTAPAVMKLSSIMRYVLTEGSNESVALEKEIQFTTHYIELQKMRLTEKSPVDFVVCGDPTGKKISPLLLLPLVENAFKYGVSNREFSPIRILLEIKEQYLHFEVSNNKYHGSNLKPAGNTGIGINNTKRRLELMHHNHYSMNIDEKDSTYTVHLNVHL